MYRELTPKDLANLLEKKQVFSCASEAETVCTDHSTVLAVFTGLEKAVASASLVCDEEKRPSCIEELAHAVAQLDRLRADDYEALVNVGQVSTVKLVLPTLVKLLWFISFHPNLQQEGCDRLRMNILLRVLHSLQHTFCTVFDNQPGTTEPDEKLRRLSISDKVDHETLLAKISKLKGLRALHAVLHQLLLHHGPESTTQYRLLGLQLYVRTFFHLAKHARHLNAALLSQLSEIPQVSMLPKEYESFVKQEQLSPFSLLDSMLQGSLQADDDMLSCCQAIFKDAGTTPQLSFSFCTDVLRWLLQCPDVVRHLVSKKELWNLLEVPRSKTQLLTSGHKLQLVTRLVQLRRHLQQTARQHGILSTIDHCWNIVSQEFPLDCPRTAAGVDPYLQHSQGFLTSLWVTCEDNYKNTLLVLQNASLVVKMGNAVRRCLGLPTPATCSSADPDPPPGSEEKMVQQSKRMIAALVKLIPQGKIDHSFPPPPPLRPEYQLWLQKRVCSLFVCFAMQLQRLDELGAGQQAAASGTSLNNLQKTAGQTTTNKKKKGKKK